MQRGYLRFNDDVHQVDGEYVPLTSKDFGVYVTGTGTYNAPSRDVSFVAIPGRSQDIVRDNGRFNNIPITYPCFIYSMSQTDFDTKLERFRNYVKKFTGWVKLQDSYHSDEYRMVSTEAEFTVEVTPDHRAGEFQLTLTAQPFRYLNSGATYNTASVEVLVNETDTFEIDNTTDYPSESDFIFVTINAGGNITIENSIGTMNAVLPAESDIKCYKFDAATGLWLIPSNYESSKSYRAQTYDTISTAIIMTSTNTVYLPSVLASGVNNVTVSCTSQTTAGGSVIFDGFIPHWRIL